MGFSVNCQPDVLSLINKEAKRHRVSRTKYVNEVLRQLFETPNALTSGTRLSELKAYSRLFGDELMTKIPKLANGSRRSKDQMLLYLIEIGIATIEAEQNKGNGSLENAHSS